MKTDPTIDQASNWVIVADEAQAIVYAQTTRRTPLSEFFSLQNEMARKKDLDLKSDRDGRSFDSFGQGRHSMTKEKADPKTHAATVFAKEIADRISRAMHDGQCRSYALVAAPKFLGLLRTALSTAGVTDPYIAIDKELVGQDTAVIQQLLEREAGH